MLLTISLVVRDSILPTGRPFGIAPQFLLRGRGPVVQGDADGCSDSQNEAVRRDTSLPRHDNWMNLMVQFLRHCRRVYVHQPFGHLCPDCTAHIPSTQSRVPD